ncbi:MAG: ribonuclease P protein component [Paracoccaceae bacterium]
MTPPEAPKAGIASGGIRPPAASACLDGILNIVLPKLVTIRNRSEFLRAATAGRQGTGSMMVQARKRGNDEDNSEIRVGFTCSKKVGNAVARNRAKRRLREVARLVLPQHGLAGWDYVLIGRAGATADKPFESLKNDLIRAISQLHQGKTMPPRPPKRRK